MTYVDGLEDSLLSGVDAVAGFISILILAVGGRFEVSPHDGGRCIQVGHIGGHASQGDGKNYEEFLQ